MFDLRSFNRRIDILTFSLKHTLLEGKDGKLEFNKAALRSRLFIVI